MHRLGHLYAVESLQPNDRVQVTYLLEETDPPMIGSVRSLDEGYVSVYFPLTQLTQLIPKEHTTRLFEPLDLVEVYIGDHTGLRGMVMFVDPLRRRGKVSRDDSQLRQAWPRPY